jgi:hypothetical protein
MTLTRVLGVWSPDSGTVAVAVIRRPSESKATTSLDSWVIVLPLASVFIFVVLYSAVYGSRAAGALLPIVKVLVRLRVTCPETGSDDPATTTSTKAPQTLPRITHSLRII